MKIKIFLYLEQQSFFYHNSKDINRRIPREILLQILKIRGLEPAFGIDIFYLLPRLLLVLGQGHPVLFQTDDLFFLDYYSIL